MKTASMLVAAVLALAAATACSATEETVLFVDTFAEGLGEGWTWLRETPDDWRVGDGALEICVRPGKADTVQNALLRPVPQGDALAFEVTVTFTTPPQEQWEQAGLVWYADGEPVFKLVHELIDGAHYIIPGRVPTEEDTVRLRLEVRGARYTAQFRQEGEEEYRTVAEDTLRVGVENHISIQCFNGPPEDDHWMRFSDFNIRSL